MTSPAIEVANLHIERDRRVILSIPRWTVARGDACVILGPNGAGKSTLLKCLAGTIRARAGCVRVLGDDVGTLTMAARAGLRRRVAYLPQLLAPGNEMPLTLREVVAIGRTGRAKLLRPLRRDDWQLVDTWIERLGLAQLVRQAYSGLSGGEQRKTLLAMTMVQEPEVLLLDEPTANLDAFWREQMVATLTALHREQALTIVLVCHDLEAIGQTTDQIVVLNRGQVVTSGPCLDVLTRSCIELLYGKGLGIWHEQGRFALVPQLLEGRA